MALIKCIDCEKMISDRIENCPHCGCPVSVSIEENEKNTAEVKNTESRHLAVTERVDEPVVLIEVDVEQEQEALFEIFAPAILDEQEIADVGEKIEDYLKNFRNISEKAVSCAAYELNKRIERHISALEYAKKYKEEQLSSALTQYKEQMNKPTEGLGFGIITNSVADVALYSAMSVHNAAMQYMKQTNAANEQLLKSLQGINTDIMMNENDVREFTHLIRKTVENLKTFAERKYFIETHKEFYNNSDKYDTCLEIEGVNIYQLISRSQSNNDVLYLNSFNADHINYRVLDKIAKEGYIDYFMGADCYGTTLKYEEAVLAEKFKDENPEEYAKLQLEKQQDDEVIYQKALEDINNGLYYEAATALASISGYKDAIEISIKLWHEKLLCQDLLDFDFRLVLGLKEDGTVLAAGEHAEKFIDKTSSWRGVEKIFAKPSPYALSFDGRIFATEPRMYDSLSYGNDYKKGNIEKWRNLETIEGRYHKVGLCKDGNLYAIGSNEDGECNVESFRNIKKVKTGMGMTVMVTDNNRVEYVGRPIEGYENWTDIVDVVTAYDCFIGIKVDGKIVSTDPIDSEQEGTHPTEWKNVVKFIGDNGLTGITKDGKVYYWGDSKSAHIISKLKDVVHIAYNSYTSIAIKADGTLIPIKCEFDLSKWKDIVGVYCDYDYIVGIKADGTIVADGNVPKDELSKWKLFEHINTRKKGQEEFVAQLKVEYEKELEMCKNELANLKGLFAAPKRKKVEERILELEQLLQ